MSGDDARDPWDRRPNEPPKHYELFRRYRDAGPLRTYASCGGSAHHVRFLPRRWDWLDRALAWDDEVHRLEDRERLEAIRSMHQRHANAGRLAMARAAAALNLADPAEIPAYAAARLLELGARLERDTLTVSVEELQRLPPAPIEDPWDALTRELDAGAFTQG